MSHGFGHVRYRSSARRAVVATAMIGVAASLVAAGPSDVAGPPPPPPPVEGETPPKDKLTARDLFIDPEDGAVDASGLLSAPGGFLPVLVPITEPAVGYGAFLGAMFFHRLKDPDPVRPVPASMTVVGGALTSNLTWAVAAGHVGYWRHDTIRYVGALAYTDLGLSWYGSGTEDIEPYEFDLETLATTQQLAFRLGGSPFFLGFRYRFAWVRSKFEDAGAIPGTDPDDYESRLGGLGLIAQMDTRDNTLTPNTGLYLEVNGTMDHPWLGSTGFFGVVNTTALVYQEPIKHLVFGLRTVAATTIGDAPFYVQPFVRLRGVPVFRYVGSSALSVEGELRWDFWKRWSIVPFGGVGAAVSDRSLTGGSFVWGAGLGARYLIARQYGVRAGIDVARGPEQFAFYVVVGSAWFRP